MDKAQIAIPNVIYHRKIITELYETVKSSIHPKLNCVVSVKKTARKTELNVLWHSTGFPIRFVSFFCQLCVSSCACNYGG